MKNLIYLCALLATNVLTFYFVSRGNETSTSTQIIEVDRPVFVAPELGEQALIGGSEPMLELSDPVSLEAVGNMLLSMEASTLKDSLIEVFAGGWFEKDHLALAEWLNTQSPEVNTDSALAVFANLASEVDPEGAVEWAASVMTPGLREQALRRAVSDFKRSDLDGFQEYIARNNRTVRAIRNAGFVDGDAASNAPAPVRYDIVEDPSEPISQILARRTRLAGPSSRDNNVDLIIE